MLLTITSLTEEGALKTAWSQTEGLHSRHKASVQRSQGGEELGVPGEQKEACGGSGAVSEDEHDPRGQEEGLEGRGSSGRVG